MDHPAHERVKMLFQSALERTTRAERSTFLDQACADDAGLRQRVDALLEAHERPAPLLDRSAAELLRGERDGGDGDDDMKGADDCLAFLAPPSKPGSLGRLGHYEALDVAGRGGMGIVFRAFDDKLQRVVAIKALAPALATSPRARQQFVREARAAAAVTHENVIAIYGVEEAGPVPYFVMQFVHGISLQEKVERSGPLPLGAVLRIGLHIAEGLAAAHRQGLVHRDVKPANILLENGVERVKITDFGLARAGGDAGVTQSGLLTGTPAYMSPEQFLGGAVEASSDLFSLGSVLYMMCTGRPPFGGSSTLAVLKQVCDDTPRPIREANAELPIWLESLLSRLLAKAPADRPASAREVADLLARRLAELRESAPNPAAAAAAAAPPQSPQASARRRGRLVLVTTLIGSLVALGLTEAAGVTNLRGALARTIRGANAGGEGRGPVTNAAVAAEDKQDRTAIPTPENKEPAPEAAADAAETEWERATRGLPPDAQVQAVAARLRELNPNFDGAHTHQTVDGVVTDFRFSSQHVADISPVRALKSLKVLYCYGPQFNRGPLADLSPLRGMRLATLACGNTWVSDLSPLKGMPLIALDCGNSAVGDLTPLKGAPLEHLVVSSSRVSDLSALRGMSLSVLLAEGIPVSDVSPLSGMPITYLGLYRTRVSDLSPLAGMPLSYLNLTAVPVADLSVLEALLEDMTTLRKLVLDELPIRDLSALKGLRLQWLQIYGTGVSDLSPLKGMPLEFLQIQGTGVSDLSPLEGMPLTGIELDFQAPRDVRVLRSLPRLESINRKPAAEFLKGQPQ